MAKNPVPAIAPDATLFEKVIAYTPVVLTVIATLLAGLSSSEMTAAQYYRSSAAQYQAKAGDQWGLFQTKRNRAYQATATVDLLAAASQAEEPAAGAGRLAADLKQLEDALATLPPGTTEAATPVQQALRDAAAAFQALSPATRPTAQDILPPASRPALGDAPLQACLEAIAARRPDDELRTAARHVNDDSLQSAIAQQVTRLHEAEESLGTRRDEAQAAARGGQAPFANLNTLARRAHDLAATLPNALRLVAAASALRADIQAFTQASTAAKWTTAAATYNREAGENLALAQLYEVRIYKADAESERHRARSQRFFFGMLAAQAGVLIATFALAVRKRSVLWVLASIAGGVAIAFGGYVYLYV